MKITKELLWKLGFHSEGKDITNKPAYRLKNVKGWYGDFQIVLGDYPPSNPNSGIVSLHQPEMKDQHCHSWATPEEIKKKGKNWVKKRIDFKENEEDGTVFGIKYITFPEKTIPIASGVTTLERLNAIYTSLTSNPPLKPTP